MRQEVINIYTFEELSPEAQARAIQDRRESMYEYPDFEYFTDEAFETIKKGLDNWYISLDDYTIQWDNARQSYFKLSFRGIECDPEDIRGVRALKWVINNAGNALTEPKPYGRYFFPKGSKKGRYPRRSKILRRESECPFTGICYDHYFMDPIRKFVANPDGQDISDIFRDAVYSVLKSVEDEIEYRYTDGAIREELIANDYDFFENGKLSTI